MFLADIINYLSIDLLQAILNIFSPLSDGSVFDVFSQILPPLTCPAPGAPIPVPTPAPGYSCGNECGGSAFYKEAAAFGTLGYYAQASWLIQIFDFGLQKIALIGYVISATATLYGFALGNVRPQKFLWFLIGPPICWFLIAELTPVKGVEWRVGNQFRDMREVWRMVEPGLANEDYIIRNGIAVRSNAAPVHAGVSFNQLCYAGGGDAYACVSDFFAYYDSLISDVVQQLVSMLGIGRAVDKHPSVANSDTNITWGHSGGAGGVNTGDPADQNNLFKWDLISSIRWDFFSGVSDARIKDPNLRRAFATFLASDCGIEFMSGIDKAKMTASAKKGTPFSTSPVVKTPLLPPPLPEFSYGPKFIRPVDCWDVNIGIGLPPNYELWTNLKSVIPTPEDVVALMQSGSSLAKESNIAWMKANTHHQMFGGTGVPTTGFPMDKIITCRAYLILLMQGLRWEAAHTAYQLITSGPVDVAPQDYLTMMFYGWDIKDAFTGRQIPSDELQMFLEAIVLGHLFRNELEVAPGQFIEKRYLTTGEQTIQNVKDFQRLNNARSKYGELYAWALMVPYFQGKLLYFLAIAYPFAAMFVVVPGMGKVFVQWLQFWMWVKLWDLGFGLVMVIERSVWAMTANNARNGEVAKVGWQIMSANRTSICTTTNHPMWSLQATPPTPPDFVPDVAVKMFSGWGVGSNTPAETHESMTCILDRLLAMSNNTDLDLTNSYYIYIMSALYFAVPAVTGQLVLGAKAGATSMITGAMSGIAQPAGGAVSNASTSEWGRRAKENQAIASQQAFGNALAKGGANGLAGQVLGAQNEGALAQLEGSSFQGRSQGLQAYGSQIQGTMSPAYTKHGEGSTGIGLMAAIARYPVNSIIRGYDTKAAFEGSRGVIGAGTGGGGPTVTPDEGLQATQGARGGAAGMGFGSAAGFGSRAGGDTSTTPRSQSGGMGAQIKAAQKRWEGVGDAMNIGTQAVNMAAQSVLAGFVRDVATASAGYNAAATDFGLAATGRQMDGQVANMAASRHEAAAGFKAESAAWGARADYADKMTDKMAAVTGSAEALNPGQKPTNLMGMAMTGMLDRGTVGAGGIKMGYTDKNGKEVSGLLSHDANAASRSFQGVGANGQAATMSGSLRGDVGTLKNDFLYAKDASGNTLMKDGKPVKNGENSLGVFNASMAKINLNDYFKEVAHNVAGPTWKEATSSGKNNEKRDGSGNFTAPKDFGLGGTRNAGSDPLSGGIGFGWHNGDNVDLPRSTPLKTRTE